MISWSNLLDRELTVHMPRSLPVDEALRLAEQVAPGFAITRVHDVTPLGILRVPVWAAVTPDAVDLTVHLGRGHTVAAAKVSAMFEALERKAAETPTTPRASPSLAERRSLAASLCLPPGSCDHVIRGDWIVALELTTREVTALPLDLVRSPSSVLPDAGRRAWTNGLASGVSRLEVVWHGICEVIERQMLAEFELVSLYSLNPDVRPVECSHLKSETKSLVDQARASGIDVFLFAPKALALTGAICVLVDRSFPGSPGPLCFIGASVDADWKDAADSAALEAVQAHTAMHMAGRESFEGVSNVGDLPDPRRHLSDLRTTWLNEGTDCLCNHSQERRSDKVSDHLFEALADLKVHGFSSIFYADVLYAPERSPIVGRVIIPGLAAPFGASLWQLNEHLESRLRSRS